MRDFAEALVAAVFIVGLVIWTAKVVVEMFVTTN
jgi:hypothetical protein